MKLRSLGKSGTFYGVYAIELNDGSCPAVEFLEQLKVDNIGSHKSMVNILARHANFGQIKNERKSKQVRPKLLEFKTYQGGRLVYFYMPGNMTVLTLGFHKGDRASQFYNRAESIRDQYLKGVSNG